MTINKQFFIPGPGGRLEAIYNEGNIDQSPVLLCHPHPLHGGSMHTKLIYWLGRLFQQQGHATLKFNFRGVGCSEGQWDEGNGESEDVYTALQWLKNNASKKQCPIWIAAFSFGCYAGLKAMQKEARVSRCFAVAPAVTLYDFSFLKAESRPVHIIHGNSDEIIPYTAVQEWSLTTACTGLTTIAGAGHFFTAQKEALEQAILQQIQG